MNHRLRPIAMIVTLALTTSLAALTVVAGTVPASAAESTPSAQPRPTSVMVDGDVLDLTAVGSALVFGTRAAGSDQVTDPARVLLTVPDEQLHASAIDASAITAALPTGATAGDVTITLVSGSMPTGGGVQVRDGGTVVLGSAGGDPRTLTVAAGSRRSDSWLFSAPGRYVLEFTASVQVTTTDGTSATWTAPATTTTIQVGGPTATTTTLSADHATLDSGASATLTATVAPADASGTVEFFDGATSLGTASVGSGKATHPAAGLADGKHALTATFTPTAPAEYASSTSASTPVLVGAANEPIQTDASPAAAKPAAADDADPQGVTVLSAGDVALTPKITNATGAPDVASFQLGLLDKTGGYPNEKWYAPDQAVLHLGAENLDGSGHWSTPASPIDFDVANACYDQYPDDDDQAQACYSDVIRQSLAEQTTGEHAKLLLGLDSGEAYDVDGNPSINPGAPTRSDNMHKTYPVFTLVSASTPIGGAVRATTPGSSAPSWDSTAATQTPVFVSDGDAAVHTGWSFTTSGKYCLTVGYTLKSYTSKKLMTEQATYTVYVGDLPATPTACAQVPASGGTGGGTGQDPVTVLSDGHMDVRSWLNSAGDGLVVGGNQNDDIPSKDLVLAGTRQATVGDPQGFFSGEDLSFIGKPGTSFSFFPMGGAPTGYLWPGFASDPSDSPQLLESSMTSLTLNGVSGPSGGDVWLWETASGGAEYVLYSSVWGLPHTVSDGTAFHKHVNWAFTKPGRYCLNFGSTEQKADGAFVHGSGQITVWAGEPSQASSVIPCDRDPSVTPAVASLPPLSVQHDQHGYVSNSEYSLIEPYLTTDGKLDVAVRSQKNIVDPSTDRDLNDVIMSVGWYVNGEGWMAAGTHDDGLQLQTDSDRVPWSAVEGPIDWRLGDIQGPGTVTMEQENGVAKFSTAAGSQRLDYQLPPSSNSDAQSWEFSKAGVYCIPFTMTVTPKGAAAPVTVSKTMTVVAGSMDPTSPDYVDRSTVTTCANGQKPTPATGGGSGDGGGVKDSDVFVPNESLTDSGAVILNDGHVDVASKLDGDTLQAWVKDTTESSVPRYHPLTGSSSLASSDRSAANNGNGTVFQLLPQSETKVPDSATYAFLGSAGSRIWQVNQVQQTALGLLWPGWSTEEVPLAATQTGVTWTLDKMTGPGEFALYTADSSQFNKADVLFNTRDGITGADSYTIPKNAHVHGNWAFSAEGTYCLGFTRSTTMADGVKASDDFTLAVAVGRVDVKKVDPGKCFDTTGKPGTTDVAPVSDSQLTDVASGGVSVLDGGAGFFPGQLVSLKLGASHAGAWVSLWLQSQPVWLGWAKVDDTGVVQVRLPVDTALGSHKLVVKSLAGDLLGWAGLSVVAAPVTGSGTQQTGVTTPVTQLAPQCTSAGPGVSVISAGHLDWNTQVIGGKLRSLIGDDSTGTRLYRDPATTVLWLKPSSQVSLPAGFGQVGAAGSTVWQVPQTQNQDLIWLGWSTELLNAGNASSPVNWSLTQVDGPGTLKVYTIGSFGDLQEMVFNGPGTHTLPLGVHVHANWAFSTQGVYRLHFTQSATLANGQASSDSEVLTIAVGNANPATALSKGTGCGAVVRSVLATGQVAPTAGQAQAQADAGQAQDGTSSDGSASEHTHQVNARRDDTTVPLLLGVLGGLLLLAAAGTGILWWRRRNTT